MTRVNRWNDPAAPSDALWSEADEQRRKKRRLTVLAVSGGVALLLVIAVWNSGAVTAVRTITEAIDPASFLDKAGRYLNRADDYIVVDLSSEEIVMRKMPDEESLILAVVLDDADQEGDQFTIFQVPEPLGNPLFLSRGDPPGSRAVQTGDTIYFFAKDDEDSGKEMLVYRNVSRPKAFKLQVKDVVDERTLRTYGGMTSEVTALRFMEIWRHNYKSEIESQHASWLEQPNAGVNWEPSPDRPVLVKATADLNQWLRESKADIEWKPDPLLIEAIAGANRQLFFKSAKQARLDELSFDLHDARFIQEAVWLRDISRTARSEISDLDKAKKLFDWTVRHIQLEPEKSKRSLPLWHRPWQTLLYGRGTATERAWVFILLARQQGLNVVMLAHPNPTEPENLKFWLPALVSDEIRDGGHQNDPKGRRQLYLFDAALGLPIPGPQGRDVATLADVLADAALLRGLDIDDDLQNGAFRYGTSAADLKPRPDLNRGLVAFIEASPRYFSKRMKLLQSEWSGDHRLVLTHNAGALRQQLEQVDGIAAVRLWPQAAFVYDQQDTMQRGLLRSMSWENFRVFIWVPSLWKARTMSFREIDEPAPRRASAARQATSSPVGVVDQARRDAIYYYLRCHRPDVDLSIEKIPAARSWLIKKRQFDQYAKKQAGYWLGLVHFDRGKYAYAADFFKNRVLEAYPGGPWQHGATYNLARALEELDEPDKAIKLYREDVSSPQRHGNLLRARRLEAVLPAKKIVGPLPGDPTKPLAAKPTRPAAKSDDLPPNPDPKPSAAAPKAAKAGG